MRLLYTLIFSILFFQMAFAQPSVPKKRFHLYMLAGQSNMAGRGAVEPEDQATHPRIWMLTKNNDWELAKDPLHFDKPVGPGIGQAICGSL